MSLLPYALTRPFLFKLDPEAAQLDLVIAPPDVEQAPPAQGRAPTVVYSH